MELQASAPKVERQDDRITISFSVGRFPVCLTFTEKQAKRISRELIEAVKKKDKQGAG